ncbi:KRRI-Interacting protein 1 [Podochytrium sp. JEL0797]|nr:KRRI-Interacting protein 1 [Podochytrium sp. JEL0797]
MKVKKGKHAPKLKEMDDADNPNMIPIPVRNSSAKSKVVASAASRREEEPSDDEFERMAPVAKGDVVTMDLSDTEDFGDESGEFKINKSFAAKYEHNKKREEITFLKDRFGEHYDRADEGSDSESDEEEDENGELLTKELDLQIMKTIGLIRSKKPEIYNPEKAFFSTEDVQKSQESWNQKQEEKKSQGKKVTLKDYHRQRLLEGGDLESDSNNDSDDESSPPVTKTYLQEQEDIKNSFKQAFAGDGDEDSDDEDDLLTSVDVSDGTKKGGMFTVRQKSQAQLDQEEADYKTFLLENMKQDGVDWTEEGAGAGDASEKFLMDFILNKQWVDEDEGAIPTYDQIVRDEHIDEDEAEEDEQDRFEQKHNFRFEEVDGENIQTFSRNIEDSMRRKDSTRADKRASVKARKAEEKLAKAEELKRLKNLKKEELRAKLQKIAEVAGTDISKFDKINLEEEFDPAKFDEMMAERFNDDYYEEYEEGGDAAAAGGLKKPVFDDGLDLDDFDYDEEDDDVPPPPGLVNENDFEIAGLVEHGLGPKTGEGKVLKKEKPIDRLALLEAMEEEKELAKKEAKSKKLKRKLEEVEEEDFDEEDNDFTMDADYLPGGEYYGEEQEEQGTGKKSKKDKKKELKEKKKLAKKDNAAAQSLDDYLEEYLKLDHEDMIGDLATRFKYRKVEPENYGISAVDILMAPETALNEFVPLKHIAPFRPEARKKRDKEIWSKTKKKKMKKLKDALEAAKIGKTLEEWENDKRIKKRKAEQAEKVKGQAAKKAEKRAKKLAAGEGGDVGGGEGDNDHEMGEAGNGEESFEHVEPVVDKPEGSEAAKEPKAKKKKKANAFKAAGASSLKGGVPTERLASYGMPSHKK